MDPLSDHNWFGLQQPPRSWEERKTSNKGLLAQFGHVETMGLIPSFSDFVSKTEEIIKLRQIVSAHPREEEHHDPS
jgi:hypothetical protein